MWNPFKKKEPALPPGAGVGPGGFDNVSVTTGIGSSPGIESPGRYPNVDAHGSGLDGWAPRIGVNLAPKPNQEQLLVHQDRPPADDPTGYQGGTPYWHARKQFEIDQQWPKQVLSATNWQTDSRAYTRHDPKETPVTPTRATSFQSPSNYRFLAPMRSGNGDVRHLNGVHFSMASNRRDYPIKGMSPVSQRRNTYRLEPETRDAQVVDLPSGTDGTPGQVYNSPNYNAAPSRGGTYRL